MCPASPTIHWRKMIAGVSSGACVPEDVYSEGRILRRTYVPICSEINIERGNGMSYISKMGEEAVESIGANLEQKGKDALKPFKSGTSYKVRVISEKECAEYYAASVYQVFNTTPVSPGNLYKKASDFLYALANKFKADGDASKAKECSDMAYQIKPKRRYLYGFINLEDGEPMIVDLSNKQADVVKTTINKYAKNLSKFAFELSKEGSGQSTSVTLSLILDMDEGLTDKERENFEKSTDAKIPKELYGTVLKEKTLEEQADDLRAFGFDVSQLGISLDSEDAENNSDPSDVF